MSRIRTGLTLAGKSLSVLRADRSLAWFPVISAAATIVAVLVAIVPFGALALALSADDGTLHVIGFAALAACTLAATTVATFFNVALASCAARALDGHDTTVSEGVAAARGRLGVIVAWSLLATVVGMAIRALERFGIAGRILEALAGLAWMAATFFVVPVLALEGVGPGDALRRSGALVRRKWGEGLVGAGAIGAASGLAVFTVVSVCAVVVYLAASAGSAAAAVPFVVLGVVAVIVIAVIASTLEQVFRVAVYRYATDGTPAGPFTETELQGAFRNGR